jgi:hypothetical protein
MEIDYLGTSAAKPSPPQALACLPVPVAIQVGVPLAQQHLGLVVGADLAAPVPALAWGWPRR